MIEIHLYGKLRRYAGHFRPMEGTVVHREVRDGETLQSVLEQTGIPTDEIGHIFFNAKLLATRNPMAPFYGYRQQRDSPFNWDLNLPLTDGDRLGLFGTDLPILGM
jgi:hypothetical protein